MTALVPPDRSEHPLVMAVEDHTALAGILGELSTVQTLAAVGRVSAHLAAMHHIVHPLAARRLDDGAVAVEELRRSAHALTVALRLLERRVSGDTRLARVPTGRLTATAALGLRVHARAEGRLVARLLATLDGEDCAALVRRYRLALEHGPTRPHPYTPIRGRLGRLAFRWDAVVDHVRDALDSRPEPWRVPPEGVPAAELPSKCA